MTQQKVILDKSKMTTRKIQVTECACAVCRYVWIPRPGRLPKTCAKCNSPNWNRTDGPQQPAADLDKSKSTVTKAAIVVPTDPPEEDLDLSTDEWEPKPGEKCYVQQEDDDDWWPSYVRKCHPNGTYTVDGPPAMGGQIRVSREALSRR